VAAKVLADNGVETGQVCALSVNCDCINSVLHTLHIFHQSAHELPAWKYSCMPSVRQLADTIGINMHTVNKAYTVLKQEGYVKVDRRKGAVIALDVDRMRAVDELRKELQVILAKSSCKNISRQEVHELIDEYI